MNGGDEDHVAPAPRRRKFALAYGGGAVESRGRCPPWSLGIRSESCSQKDRPMKPAIHIVAIIVLCVSSHAAAEITPRWVQVGPGAPNQPAGVTTYSLVVDLRG